MSHKGRKKTYDKELKDEYTPEMTCFGIKQYGHYDKNTVTGKADKRIIQKTFLERQRIQFPHIGH
jgi:hypothetical protein